MIAGALLMAGTAFAQTPSHAGGYGGSRMGGMRMMPGVFGTVSAINGDILTLTSKGFGSGTTAVAKTYTVDATNATVFKNSATSTLSAVAVGDMVMAAGTLNGTSLTATSIRDGFAGGMGGSQGGKGIRPGMHASSTPMMQGNGQPVVGGTVSAISGNTLTVTTAQGNVTYTIDVTNATVTKGNVASTASAIAVGDKVVVQGAVNGDSVTATTVSDSGSAPSLGGASTMKGGLGKVINSIGGFFHSLFGFF